MTTRLTSALIAVATPLMFAAVAGASVALANSYFTRDAGMSATTPRLLHETTLREKPDCLPVREEVRNETDPANGEQF